MARLLLFVCLFATSLQLAEGTGGAITAAKILSWDNSNDTIYVTFKNAQASDRYYIMTSNTEGEVAISSAATSGQKMWVVKDSKLEEVVGAGTRSNTTAMFTANAQPRSGAGTFIWKITGVNFIGAGDWTLLIEADDSAGFNSKGSASANISPGATFDPTTKSCTVHLAYTCEDADGSKGCKDDKRLTFQWSSKTELAKDATVGFHILRKATSTNVSADVAKDKFFTSTTATDIHTAVASTTASTTGVFKKYGAADAYGTTSTQHTLTAKLTAGTKMWFSLDGADVEEGAEVVCFSGNLILGDKPFALAAATKVKTTGGATRNATYMFAVATTVFAALNM